MNLFIYLKKSIKTEKKNHFASSLVFLALFSSLQALLGFGASAVNSFYFYSPGFRSDCYYYTLDERYPLSSVPLEYQGVTGGVTVFEDGRNITYQVKATEACAKTPLGFLITSRIYFMPDSAPSFVLPESGTYSIAYNVRNPQKEYFDDKGVSYPLIGNGSLLKNRPAIEQIQALGFSSYSVVALFNPAEDSSLSGRCVVSYPGFEPSNTSWVSGDQLNRQYQEGRKQIPSIFYVGLLLPFIVNLVVAFGIISSLDRKAASEIYSLRLIGVPYRKCHGMLFLRRMLEALFGFCFSFVICFPIMASFLPDFAPAMLIGQAIILCYVVLAVLIHSSSFCKTAFFRKKKKGDRHAED